MNQSTLIIGQIYFFEVYQILLNTKITTTQHYRICFIIGFIILVPKRNSKNNCLDLNNTTYKN